ncbi:MAG: transglutaminase family protein [Hylemonella sp.]|nr:transglutaminase family protein [Hylemonella sp.]
MLLQITHQTRYLYSQPVFLEPFVLRLRPRSDANQTVRSYHIDVTPTPEGVSHCIELDGNNSQTIWFSGLHQTLSLEVRTLVQTHHEDPFNFLLTDASALGLPLRYQPDLALALSHCLQRPSDSPQVMAFAQEVMQRAKGETIPFLTLLAQQIPVRLKYMLREHGEPWTADETLRRGEGSCRDFAVLFTEACRSVGIAARFVSGYCMGDVASGQHMHAWAEVYLPGAGWRGFDPSRGATTSDDHISVAASYHPAGAAPTCGSFRGQAESSMEVSISMRRLEPAEAG